MRDRPVLLILPSSRRCVHAAGDISISMARASFRFVLRVKMSCLSVTQVGHPLSWTFLSSPLLPSWLPPRSEELGYTSYANL